MQIDSFNRARVIGNYMRCCIHCLVPYMVYNHGMWFFQSEPNAKVFDYTIFVLHAFVMESFMFLSGYFTSDKSNSLKGVYERVKTRLFFPSLLSAIFTIPLLYLLKASYAYPDEATIKKAASLFAQDFLSHGLPLAHYWFIFYLILFSFLAYFLPLKNSVIALACIVIGLSINSEAMIRNPIYLSINLPSFFYYFGYYLLGMVWRNKTDFSNLGKWWIWALVFLLNLSISGYYILAYQLHQKAFLDFLLQPIFFGTCAFTGCIFFIRLMETININFSNYQIESTYFIYLFHLPIAIAFQLFFKVNDITEFWVPIVVIITSISLVHVLNKLFGKHFFEISKRLSSTFTL